MGNYILRRVLMVIPIMLGVSLLTFAIIKITPGDPVRIMLGNRATEANIEQIREQLGLNDPVIVQYGRYVWRALHGDLGNSIRGGTPVLQEILDRLPSTVQLTFSALLLAFFGGVTTGLIAAVYRGRAIDRSTMLLALMGISIPEFWLAIVLIIVFGLELGWVSVTGDEGLKSLVLPSICLAVGPGAVLARLTRSSVLEVIQDDYIVTARSKGLSERVIAYRHILRNAFIPVITVMGLILAEMLGGAIFIEAVFARPGLGRFALNAIMARDFPQIQGMVLFTALVYCLINLGIDILYTVIDPRIRYS